MGNTSTNGRARKARFYNFEEALAASGMTQSELARKIGRSRQYVSMLKYRYFRPSAKMVIKLEEVLGLDVKTYR